jgi:hypothetical protein
MPKSAKASTVTVTVTGTYRVAKANEGAGACPRPDGINLSGARWRCRPRGCTQGSLSAEPAQS